MVREPQNRQAALPGMSFDARPSKAKVITSSGEAAPIHRGAYTDGVKDGRAGVRQRAADWPPGIYGHASYEIGYDEGRGLTYMHQPFP